MIGALSTGACSLDWSDTQRGQDLADGGEQSDGGFGDGSVGACLVDEDGDGFGVQTDAVCQPDVKPGDCDDADSDVHPGATDICGDQLNSDCDEAEDGSVEVCNGLDDDCDGEIDEGVLLPFYNDADGDGFGAGEPSAYACQAPPGSSALATDCSDGNPEVSPQAAELCDGIDNNCSQTQDETFVCVKGAEGVECTTSCGSVGRGTCTDTCEKPTGIACIIPAESCNAVDDDCDGLINEGVLHTYPNAHISAVETESRNVYTYGSVHARAEGGAWLLYGAGAFGSGIAAERVDDMGNVVATAAGTLLTETAGGQGIYTDSNQNWIVVAANISGTQSRLQVYDSTDMTRKDEHVLTTGPQLSEVSMHESADGTLCFLVAYVKLTSPDPGIKVVVSRRNSAGIWSDGAPTTLLDTNLGSRGIAAADVPCRDEWVIAYGGIDPGDGTLAMGTVRRVDRTGALVGPSPAYAIADANRVTQLKAAPSDCGSVDPELIIGTVGAGTKSYGYRIRVSRTSGLISVPNPMRVQFGTGLEVASFVSTGGRWYVVSLASTGSQLGPTLAELDFGTLTPTVRMIDLAGVTGADPGSTGHTAERLGIAATKSGLLTTLGISPDEGGGSTIDALYSSESPADTRKPVAVTYAVGCP